MGKHFLDNDGFLYKKKPKNKLLTVPLEREVIQPVYFTDDELCYAKGSVLLFDCEIYPNYFLVAFKQYIPKNYDNKTIELIKNNEAVYEQAKVVTFELYPDRPVFNYSKLLWVMHNFCLVGFNSIKFDIPILNLALQGASLDQIYEAVEKIIKYDAQPYDIEAYYGFKSAQTNNVDLIEVAPSSASLKLYGGRLHAPRLQDLPFDPATYLDRNQVVTTRLYCINDLDLTGLLLHELEPQLELRAAMGQEYKLDLRSKSDAQIAESIICSEVKKIIGHWPKRPKINSGTSFKYNIPEFIKYKNEELKNVIEIIKNSNFVLEENGSIKLPEKLEGYKINIGNSTYRMGIGGLHSSEECVCYRTNENYSLCDVDATSFYPSIIINQKLFPEQLTSDFISLYSNIFYRRIEAKKSGNKVVADSLKIVLNSSFGKFSNKYSSLYSPQLLIQVTITGQLSLLLLIELIELEGISVVSANTDGIVIYYAKKDYKKLINCIKYWEHLTGFSTEETRYRAIYIASVNNYIAICE